MPEKYILTIDQGTTATKVALFSLQGQLKTLSANRIKQYFPKEGWVEQEPYDILDSIKKGIADVISETGIDNKKIISVAVDNQGETVIPFDRFTGEPLYRAIVWQDRRTASLCAKLKGTIDEKIITKKCGLFLDPYFSASKLSWLIENVDSVKQSLNKGRAILATSDAWLLYKLAGGKSIYTDVSTASRTSLFNINTVEWDEELAYFFKIPAEALPEVVPSSYDFGFSDPAICSGITAPVNASVLDQAASLFGHTCLYRGETKITYGTGGFLLINIGEKRIPLGHKIITTIAAQYDSSIQYALDGGIYCVGACINWLVEDLKIVSAPELTGKIASSLKDNGGVYFVPALSGLSVPYWEPNVKGAFVGLSQNSSRKHLVRAVLEGIAYRFLEIINVIKKGGFSDITSISVDGGVSKNDFLVQFQADLLGIRIQRPLVKEVTSLGAFYLAGLRIGLWSDVKELKDKLEMEKIFHPQEDNSEKLAQFKVWKNALANILSWHKDIKSSGV